MPSAQLEPRFRTKRVGLMLRACEIMCVLLTIGAIPVGFNLANKWFGGSPYLGVICILPGIGLGVGAALLHRLASSALAPDADEVLKHDTRRPILFLRSHIKDSLWALKGYGGLEQDLVDAFENVGPLIALGKPGEQFSVLGAARLYTSHEEWQSKVTELLTIAGSVVYWAGQGGDGLAWEWATIVRCVHPMRVLVIAEKRDDYNEWCRLAVSHLPMELPFPDWKPVKYFDSGFMFDETWKPTRLAPVLVELSDGMDDGPIGKKLSVALTIEPFIKQLSKVNSAPNNCVNRSGESSLI